MSFYTGRGCRSKCTFCLWPQTVGGHRYRVRSADSVVAEVEYIQRHFPEVKEVFFDDDTFTDFKPRVEDIARRLGRIGVTWSCNAKANVPYKTLKVMKDNGLRLLLVGYESGNDRILHNIKKGLRTNIAAASPGIAASSALSSTARSFSACRGKRARPSLRPSTSPARSIRTPSRCRWQVSLAAPYPGTALYRQAVENGWLKEHDRANLVNDHGVQLSPISYPDLAEDEIFKSVETFYRRFYFRPRKVAALTGEMLRSPEMMRRRLREGREFARFLRTR